MGVFEEARLDHYRQNLNLISFVKSLGFTGIWEEEDYWYLDCCPACKRNDHHFWVSPPHGDIKEWQYGCDCEVCDIEVGDVFKFITDILKDTEVSTLNDLKIKYNLDKFFEVLKLKDTFKFLCRPTTDNYFSKRGLSTEIQKKYLLGGHPEGLNFLIKRHNEILTDKPNDYTKVYRYFFPVIDIDDEITYFISRIDTEADIPDGMDMKNKYRNLSNRSIRLFNDRYIFKPTLIESNILFICEGILDALSIEEIGYEALALNSTSNVNELQGLILEQKRKHDFSQITFIIASDNDKAGKKMSDELCKFFKHHNLRHDIFSFPDKYNDVNEFLMADRNRLRDLIERLIATLGAPHATIRYTEQYVAQINENKTIKPIDTGFTKFNQFLGGGFFPGLYTVGAISSLGKTTWILQIADYIAACGTDVIFFSLEMSKFEIVSKSLSRSTGMIAKETKAAVGATLRDVMQGKASHQVLTDAFERYAPSAKYLSIIEGNFNMDITMITDYLTQHMMMRNTKPIVIIDYLQILRPESDRLSDKQAIDRNVTHLKRLSRQFDLTILLISSFNRENYCTPVSYSSFKESGSLEYSSDCLMGLQLSAIHQVKDIKNSYEKNALLDNAKKEKPRNVELIILKQRNGVPWAKVPFKYYAEFNLFEEAHQ